MELRELLVVDPDSLTPAQAQQVTKDVIGIMSRFEHAPIFHAELLFLGSPPRP